MLYEYDQIVHKTIDGEDLEYRFLFGSEKIVFIKVGAGEDIDKDQDGFKRYIEIAERMHKSFGATVVIASNPDAPHTALDEKAIRWVASKLGYEEFKLYFWGISDGAYQNLKLAQKFPETIKFIGVNTSFITFADLEEKLQALPCVKKFLFYGTKDDEFDVVFPALRDKQDEYLRTIFVGGADHRFSEMPEQIIYSVDLVYEDDAERDIISFGRYWNGTGMENVPIDWIVLDEDEDNLFLVSKQAIVTKPLGNEDNEGWEHSSIRKWLNNDFLNLAFNEHERYLIATKELTTPYEEYYDIPAVVEQTKDKVLLLSMDDLGKYFSTREARVAEQSRYSISTLKEHGMCEFANSWWLRNGGNIGHNAWLVLEDGMGLGYGSEQYPAGIRPAMYIKKDWFEHIPVEGQLTLF